MMQFISIPLKIELISDTNAQFIQNSITSYHKNRERTRKTKRERKKGKIIGHMTERKRRQNRVAAFLYAAANGSMKLLRSEHPRIIF